MVGGAVAAGFEVPQLPGPKLEGEFMGSDSGDD